MPDDEAGDDARAGRDDAAPVARVARDVDPRIDRVEVDGGTLAVARWGCAPTVALAAHGITSTHRFWSLVGPLVADTVSLLAPDLRGRGDSADLPGPHGMARHADDLAAVLDAVGARDAVVVGHSMGGFVAATFAIRHPDRTRAVLLIDGGPPLGPPPDEDDVERVLHAIVGTALDRLDRRFASREEYRAFWHAHPAFDGTGADAAHVDAYADHDLVGPPGDLRPKADPEAVRADARYTLVNDAVHGAVARVDAPTVMLLAERGMLDDATPLYGQDLVRDVRTARGPLRTVRVPGTNHYTIGLSERGARAIAHHLRELVEEGTS